MGNKVKWGILGNAKIGREKVIPALQKSPYCKVVAIASRDKVQVKKTARLLKIGKAYGSYEELLNDKDIEAVYIPLPNHLHVDWAIKCIAAGKHVLCEKPIGLSYTDALRLMEASAAHPKIKVMEGFMYRFHPQWIQVKRLINLNRIGELKMVQSFFSYYNADPSNIRNKVDVGGGALMDIGCYGISLSRFLFGEEPDSVMGSIERDPEMHTDKITSGMLEFPKGRAIFTCATQLMPYQRVNVMGTAGRIEIEMPFNPLPDQQTKITLYTKEGQEDMIFEAADQYTLQASAFSKAIVNDEAVPYPIQDALNNMKVIDAILESARVKREVNFPATGDKR
ncbi:Gfo/Idh/MocA family protein [Pedobacter heparinus]|uniref:Oxidoreductase domain protein n=1 Tax=Pedobacter heparinus (strain ATCC 13125 / DSM 2366 / CIP 104194 / JCM 7457 / NBRC 12017 / NCIMB 9290 / NRRL B-14731 / HIM 762-3) TaxID=485917 RepID=C6Y333_PEDHD|nr:Gfo/Idh/MocA family oxidoreductase [Pedobacter heparinus]ACU03246.1 oxidoreductase domain protein [Pedobacter heparinus DSM 2366]